MDGIEPVHHYRISGLHVRSEIEICGSIDCDPVDSAPDVQICVGPVPTALDDAHASGPNWQSATNRFLVEIPSVVRFLVTGGSQIDVEPIDDMPLADAAVFVAGTGMAVALYQRGSLLLHASAVMYGERAFAFSGPSGAGKSTLAALLCRDAGCEMISDDITAISCSGERPVLQADGRQLRLWDDMVQLLSLADQRGPAVRSSLAKYHVRTSATSEDRSKTLAGIYLLEALPNGSTPVIEAVTLSESAALLDDNLYRRALSTRFEDHGTRFLRIAKLLQTVPVWRLRRPVEAAANPRVIACLQSHWRSLP
jgi:hypothetical protein